LAARRLEGKEHGDEKKEGREKGPLQRAFKQSEKGEEKFSATPGRKK